MSNVTGATNYFPTANEGFATTLGSTITAGATTVPLTTTSGLTNGSVFVGIIEPGTANQETYTGTVNTGGGEITGCVWTRTPSGGSVAHVAGVSIVDYVTGTAINLITTGILKQHNQNGSHGYITTTGYSQPTGSFAVPAGVIGSTALATNAVQPNQLATTAITIGYSKATGNQTPSTGIETAVTGCSVTVTVPAGGRDIEIVGTLNLTSTGSPGQGVVNVKEGSTYLKVAPVWIGNATNVFTATAIVHIGAPSAGTHTYFLTGQMPTTVGQFYSSSGYTNEISVKLV